MSVTTRIDRLSAANPPAVALARLCSLAVRVEPPLLRALRLLIPDADASAEADLWFSDLLSGADPTAMTLDPLVADALRPQLRHAARRDLLEAAAARIAGEHATAHWSVRLEERIHYLDAARPPGADDEIDDLLVAAVDALRTEPDPRGIARWLFGAAGRLPRAVAERVACRASTAAAALHLDQQALTELLDPAESHAWLAWIAQTLPTVDVAVSLVDGAVLIGTPGPNAHQVSAPQTDPLVLELRWTDGRRAVGTRARFRLDEPVHVETGTRSVTLVTLAGTSYDLVAVTGVPAGIRFDQFKAGLRPCLARESQIAELLDRYGPSWYEVTGEVGSGKSTLLVAAADEAVARGDVVIEHYFNVDPPLDDPATVRQSLLAQLVRNYLVDFDDQADLTAALAQLAELGAFRRRRLFIVLDGVGLAQFTMLDLPTRSQSEVRYLVSSPDDFDISRIVELDVESNRQVCRAMIEREQAALAPSDIGRLTGWLPGRLKRILAWLARQPESVSSQRIPAVLTTEWGEVRARYMSSFGPATEILFDMLSLGHGRHTQQDCREATESSPDLDVETWSRFWSSCVSDNLVAVRDDDMVELTAPEAADVLAQQYYVRPGHRLLGSRHEKPFELARTASPTRLAAAVWHELADRAPQTARDLCTDLTVLRRRYATDLAGLLADLAALGGSDMTTLHGVIAGLAHAGVSPAEFVPALYDRLASNSDLRLVPELSGEDAPVGPLRVRQVIEEQDLRPANDAATFYGPVLAIANVSKTPVLIRRDNVVTIGAGPLGKHWPAFDGASRGRFGGFVAWTATTVYIENGVALGPIVGRIDHVSRLALGAVAAKMDGSLEVLPFDQPPAAYPGSGVRVTSIAAEDMRVVAGHEDGTVRVLDQFDQRESSFVAHRGAIRGIVLVEGIMVSGGDDGCLLEWRLSGRARPVSRWQGESAITCMTGPVNNLIVFGTADGRVCTRDLTTGDVHVLGTHDGPVRGVEVASGVFVSWSDSVLFTSLRGVVGRASGFPGGISDVLAGDETYIVLCGDGTVTQRAMPTLDPLLLATDAPATTSAELADGSVVIGTSAGVLRHWPPDAAHGPVTLPRRAGAITAMALVERWLLIGGEDGRVALWATDPITLVREIDLGAPVRSVAAEPGLVTARDAHGRLWTFSLDPYPELPRLDLLASIGMSRKLLELHADAAEEVTAIRAFSEGVPIPVRVAAWWPEIDSNGELVVPIRPLPDHPIRLVLESGDEWPWSDSGRSVLDIEVDIVSRNQPGYRTTIKPYISWRSFTR